MRTYLVVIDETDEALLALRFATRRAAKTGGAVHILALVEPQDFADPHPHGWLVGTIIH